VLVVPGASNRVFQDILAERIAQDEQWGGPEHDDNHAFHEWITFIRKQLTECNRTTARRAGFRKYMIRVAALAIAAIESQDRYDSGTSR